LVSLEELSFVFHKVDGVTAGGDLGLEFGVGELVSSIFGGASGGFVGSEGGDIFELGLGTSDVLLVVRDSEGEVEDFSSEVSDSGVEGSDFTVESTSEGGEGLKSLSLSFSLDGEGGLEVLLDVVKDSEEGIDHTLVGNTVGSLGDHSDDVEDLGVSVGETLLVKRLEGLDVGGELGESGGLGLEESSFFSTESFFDDGSSLMHHGSDGGVLGNGLVESFDESGVLLIKSLKHGGSLTEFLLSVTLFGLSVSEDGGVDHLESLVLDNGGFEGVSLSVESVHLSSASVSNDTIGISGGLSFGTETFSDILDHGDNVGNVVFRFKLEFNSVGEGLSEIGSFDLSEEVGGGVGSDDEKYEDS